MKEWNPEESTEEQDLQYCQDCTIKTLFVDLFLHLCVETVVAVWIIDVFVAYIRQVSKDLEKSMEWGWGRSLIAFSQPRECYKQNSIHPDSRGRKKYESNGYQKGWTNKTWDVITNRCFSHLSRHSVGSQVSYSQDDLEKSTLSLASVFVLSACMCTSVCVCVCGLWRSGHYFLLLSVLAAGHVWVAW